MSTRGEIALPSGRRLTWGRLSIGLTFLEPLETNRFAPTIETEVAFDEATALMALQEALEEALAEVMARRNVGLDRG